MIDHAQVEGFTLDKAEGHLFQCDSTKEEKNGYRYRYIHPFDSRKSRRFLSGDFYLL